MKFNYFLFFIRQICITSILLIHDSSNYELHRDEINIANDFNQIQGLVSESLVPLWLAWVILFERDVSSIYFGMLIKRSCWWTLGRLDVTKRYAKIGNELSPMIQWKCLWDLNPTVGEKKISCFFERHFLYSIYPLNLPQHPKPRGNPQP